MLQDSVTLCCFEFCNNLCKLAITNHIKCFLRRSNDWQKSKGLQYHTMQIITLLLSLLTVSADLIGWNRMANNLDSRARHLPLKMGKFSAHRLDTLKLKRFWFEQQTGMSIKEYKRNLLMNHRRKSFH